MDDTVKSLLADISTYCQANGTTKSSFGRAALSDPNFVSDLENDNRCPTTKTVRRVRKFMEGK